MLEPSLNTLVNDAISDTGGLDRRMNAQTGAILAMDKGVQIYNKFLSATGVLRSLLLNALWQVCVSRSLTVMRVKVLSFMSLKMKMHRHGVRTDVIVDNASITKTLLNSLS